MWWWGFLLLTVLAFPAAADPVRGEYLARAADCASCHTQAGQPDYSGGRALLTPLGKIIATNITPDRDTGIGAYSLKDFDRAVRKGVAKDGHHLYPAMPYPSFARSSDQDIADLYDYFMRRVTPVRHIPPKTRLPFPFNLRWGLVFWNWLFRPHDGFMPRPQHDARWNRGAYLVETLGHCGGCHTPRGIAYQEVAMTAQKGRFLTGGTQEVWYAPTLRQDRDTGLAAWSEGDIAAFLGTGRARGFVAFGAMAEVVEKSTQYLTDGDRAAIAHYLKSLPQESRRRLAPAYATNMQELPGAGLYAQTCAGCHGVNGEGRGRNPVLAGNPALLAGDPSSVVHMILKGRRAPALRPGTGQVMPGFELLLSDQQVAEVASYVRQAFGNHAMAVDPGRVRDARKTLKNEPVTKRPAREQALPETVPAPRLQGTSAPGPSRGRRRRSARRGR